MMCLGYNHFAVAKKLNVPEVKREKNERIIATKMRLNRGLSFNTWTTTMTTAGGGVSFTFFMTRVLNKRWAGVRGKTGQIVTAWNRTEVHRHSVEPATKDKQSEDKILM